ncbi:MAG: hypothetical protein LBS16_01645 [Prevotellaceae bacterium]|nr:hypothetical protein [Prevotellaceae bacterium]
MTALLVAIAALVCVALLIRFCPKRTEIDINMKRMCWLKYFVSPPNNPEEKG